MPPGKPLPEGSARVTPLFGSLPLLRFSPSRAMPWVFWMTGEPLPQCQFRVEPSYERAGPEHECVNPGFFDAGDGPEPAFDLRDALA